MVVSRNNLWGKRKNMQKIDLMSMALNDANPAERSVKILNFTGPVVFTVGRRKPLRQQTLGCSNESSTTQILLNAVLKYRNSNVRSLSQWVAGNRSDSKHSAVRTSHLPSSQFTTKFSVLVNCVISPNESTTTL